MSWTVRPDDNDPESLRAALVEMNAKYQRRKEDVLAMLARAQRAEAQAEAGWKQVRFVERLNTDLRLTLDRVREGLGALIPEDWTSAGVPADGDFESIAIAWAEEQEATLTRVRELQDRWRSSPNDELWWSRYSFARALGEALEGGDES